MGASFSAPEYSLKVADVSKIRTLNAIARNTLWPGGDEDTISHDKSVKRIPQSWSGGIFLIFPRRYFGVSFFFFFLSKCWLNLLELRDTISTLWDIQTQHISQQRATNNISFRQCWKDSCWSVPSVVIFTIKDVAKVAPTALWHTISKILWLDSFCSKYWVEKQINTF